MFCQHLSFALTYSNITNKNLLKDGSINELIEIKKKLIRYVVGMQVGFMAASVELDKFYGVKYLWRSYRVV